MSLGQSVRLLATYYRKSARLVIFIILLASFAIPVVLASSPGSRMPAMTSALSSRGPTWEQAICALLPSSTHCRVA
jgi:hypothetical protein